MTHKMNSLQHQYFMEDSMLQVVKHDTYLGVEQSNDLTLAKHITPTANSANKMIGFIKRNFWNCKPSVKDIAYKTLVRPTLEYGSSIWDPYRKTYKDHLEKVERRAARFVNK